MKLLKTKKNVRKVKKKIKDFLQIPYQESINKKRTIHMFIHTFPVSQFHPIKYY